MAIRVYIVEDHPAMRETLQDYLALKSDVELCGMAASAEDASLALAAAAPDLVVVDLSLPGKSGLEFLKEIRERWGTPCLILSGHGERSHVGRAFAAGAKGYVLKGKPSDIPRAIRAIMAGGTYISDSLRRHLDQEPDGSGA